MLIEKLVKKVLILSAIVVILVVTVLTITSVIRVFNLPVSEISSRVADQENDQWRIYRQDDYGFEFEYPSEWGDASSETSTFDPLLPDGDTPSEYQGLALNEIREKVTRVFFENKNCSIADKFDSCNVQLVITPYSEKKYLDLICQEGLCLTSNMIEEKEMVEETANLVIAGYPAKIIDSHVRAGGSLERKYIFFTPQFRVRVIASYRTRDLMRRSNKPVNFDHSEIGRSLTLDDVLEMNKEISKYSDFKLFLSNVESIAQTFQFINPVDTSTWQTYRSQEYGIEFQYPDTWTVNQYGLSPNLEIYSALISEQTTVCDEMDTCQQKELSNKQVIEDGGMSGIISFAGGRGLLIASCSGNEDGDLIPTPLYQLTFFNGDRSYKILLNDLTIRFDPALDCNSGQYIQEVIKAIPNSIADEKFEVYNQLLKMIPTLKFNDSTDTSGWQTYRNEEYGFSIDYPLYLNMTEPGAVRGPIAENPVKFEIYKPPEQIEFLGKEDMQVYVRIKWPFSFFFNEEFNSLSELLALFKKTGEDAKIVTVAGNEVIYQDLSNESPGSGSNYIYYHQGQFYEVQFLGGEDYLDDQKKMVDSFEFID